MAEQPEALEETHSRSEESLKRESRTERIVTTAAPPNPSPPAKHWRVISSILRPFTQQSNISTIFHLTWKSWERKSPL